MVPNAGQAATPDQEDRALQWLSDLDWMRKPIPELVAETTNGPTECACRLAHMAFDNEDDAFTMSEWLREQQANRASSTHQTHPTKFVDVFQDFAGKLHRQCKLLFIEQTGCGVIKSVRLLHGCARDTTWRAAEPLTAQDAKRVFHSPNVAVVIVDAVFSYLVKYAPPTDAASGCSTEFVTVLRMDDGTAAPDAASSAADSDSDSRSIIRERRPTDTQELLARARDQIHAP